MPFKIVRNDITKIKADAIVNTANPKPRFASGTDAAIYTAAGKMELLQARMAIGDIAVGEVAVTPAFKLDAQYIIHTVGPAWQDGRYGEFDKLYSCYEKSLNKAKELECKSIAFPLISTGVYGFPKDEALQIAIRAISKFLMDNDMQVTLVVFDKKSFELSGKLFAGVDEYIDEHYVKKQTNSEYNLIYEYPTENCELEFLRLRRREICIEQYEDEYESAVLEEDLADECMIASAPMSANLDDIVGNLGNTFQERLLQLVDERGLTDVEVYKKANIDRKLFSKIRCNVDYKPKKKTAVALAIALELDLKETEDLLGRAEIALSPSSKFDLIIRYFISNQIYDVYAINMALFKHNQPILGE